MAVLYSIAFNLKKVLMLQVQKKNIFLKMATKKALLSSVITI